MTFRIVVDQTHVRGHVTGIERVALALFSPESLSPYETHIVGSRGLAGMILEQHLGLPLRGLFDRRSVFVFPGFPPGPLSVALGPRCLIYVHDTFLVTRPEDLSWKARWYMAPSFQYALRHGLRFLVNSETTGEDLRRFTRPEAEIALLRPEAADVFGLAGTLSPPDYRPGEELRLVAIGTIEPRKNYPSAIATVAALNAIGIPSRLDIVGRVGWGEHPFLAAPPPFVHLHHGVDDAGMRAILARSHLLLSTSKAEGLGLPLLEVQHGGFPVVAPPDPVFREVLAGSGLHVNPTEPGRAAAAIAAWISEPGRLAAASAASHANIARWTKAAREDLARFRRSLDIAA